MDESSPGDPGRRDASRPYRSGRFGMVPARAYDDVRMTDALIAVLGLLATYGDRDGWAHPRCATLAERRGVTRQAISKAIGLLVRYGYVEVREQLADNGGQLANNYRIRFDLDLDAEHERTGGSQVAGGATLRSCGGSNPKKLRGEQPQKLHLGTDHPNRPDEQTSPTDSDPPLPERGTTTPSDDFATFWSVYPRKDAKGAAKAKWEKAVKAAGGDSAVLVSAAERFRDDPNRPEGRYTPQAQTWLAQERWTDGPLPERRAQRGRDPDAGAREYLERKGLL